MIVYCIENKINGKRYIGKTTYTLKNRWARHCSVVKTNNINNMYHLHHSMKKYGIDNFFIYKIDDANTQTELNEKEQYWIKQLNTKEKGYNETYGGEGTIGYKYTEEQKKKISIGVSNYWLNLSDEEKIEHGNKTKNHWNSLTEEEKNIIRNKQKGKTYIHTEQAKKAIGDSRRGKKMSDESKNKLKNSRIGKGTGQNNCMSRLEIREKQKMACVGRKKMFREDGTWYWGRNE